MRIFNHKQNRRFNFLACIFAFFLAGGFQLAEGTEVSAEILKQNLADIEKRIRDFHREIKKIRQEVDPAVYQTEKLEKENAEITAVLNRQVPKLSTFPWINLSQPEKFKFTDLNGKKIGTIIDKAESLSINTREVFSKQLSVFSGTVVNVENKNRKLRVEYKEARKTHEENRRQAQNRQRSQWAQNKGGLSGTGTDAGSLKSKKSFWKNFWFMTT